MGVTVKLEIEWVENFISFIAKDNKMLELRLFSPWKKGYQRINLGLIGCVECDLTCKYIWNGFTFVIWRKYNVFLLHA